MTLVLRATRQLDCEIRSTDVFRRRVMYRLATAPKTRDVPVTLGNVTLPAAMRWPGPNETVAFPKDYGCNACSDYSVVTR
jgi:hypothetical protein